MDINVRRKIELLAQNRQIIKKDFWDSSLMSIVGSFILTGQDQSADPARLNECRAILKKNTGIISSFRSTSEIALVCKMALSHDPEQYIRNVKSVYDKICKGRFADNGYMILCATMICDQGREMYADQYVAKFNELMKKMSKIHPLLTDSSDMAFAMLLALTDKSVDRIISDMETCYSYLKKDCKCSAGSNAIQGISEILAISDGDMRERCNRAMALLNAFSSHKVKYGREQEFASLGALVDLDIDTDKLVSEIIEADQLLKSVKGFDGFIMSSKTRLMFAALIVSSVYSGNNSLVNSTVIGNSVAVIIAEELATMMVIMMCSTSANY